MTLTLNGATYDLAAGTYFQEVKLDRLPTVGRNVLIFTLSHREGTLGERPEDDRPENRLRVSSASLVLEK
jgi:hypothetical protein